MSEEQEKAEEIKQTENVEQELTFEDGYPNAEYVRDESLTEEQTQKMLDELKTGKRYFEVMDVGRLYIRTPTVEETQYGSLVYAKAFNEALRAGLELQESLEKEFIERGIIEDENDPKSKVSVLRSKLIQLEKILSSKDPKDTSKKTRKLARELAEVRAELIEIQVRKQQLLASSAEARAEDVRNGYLISRVTYKEDDTRLWETYEDFLEERNMLLVAQVTYEFMTFSYGLSSNYLEEFPEVKFLERK